MPIRWNFGIKVNCCRSIIIIILF